MQKPFLSLAILALTVSCLSPCSLVSASSAGTSRFHTSVASAALHNTTVYLYSSSGPQEVVGASIQEGAVYDSANVFVGTVNPADSQIYDTNNVVIGFVSPAIPR